MALTRIPYDMIQDGIPFSKLGITLGANLSMAEDVLSVSGLASVALSGAYTDLSGRPTIPSAIFSTIAVSGQSSVVADSATDTLTLANGTGITITTNATTDTITIATSITQYTDEMAQDTVAAMIQNGTGISWSYNDASNTLTPTVSLASFTTANLTENTNLYFTTARARSSISASGSLSYNSSTGVMSFTETYSSASSLLTAIKTVDGTGSGLDADLLDGNNSDAFFILASNTSDNITEGSTKLLMTSAERTKLSGIASGAEVNQNAFTTIAVSGQSDVVADSKTDTLTLVAGTNIAITTNAGTDAITIATTGLATVATTGAYNDLSGKPTIPSTTTDISEGTNLYFTRARAIDSFIAGTNISFSAADGNGRVTISASGGGGAVAAEDVSYDNTVTSLPASDVQDAIDILGQSLIDLSTTVAYTSTLGTAAFINTGTSGSTIPLLSGINSWSAAQVGVPLSVAYASSITLALNAANNYVFGALTGSLTLNNPSNALAGQSGFFEFVQDGTGGKSVVFSSNFKPVDGLTITISQGASERSRVAYYVRSSTAIDIWYVGKCT